jgi:hypothetical protein
MRVLSKDSFIDVTRMNKEIDGAFCCRLDRLQPLTPRQLIRLKLRPPFLASQFLLSVWPVEGAAGLSKEVWPPLLFLVRWVRQ